RTQTALIPPAASPCPSPKFGGRGSLHSPPLPELRCSLRCTKRRSRRAVAGGEGESAQADFVLFQPRLQSPGCPTPLRDGEGCLKCNRQACDDTNKTPGIPSLSPATTQRTLWTAYLRFADNGNFGLRPDGRGRPADGTALLLLWRV